MKTIFLHGLGQTARAWDAVTRLAVLPETDCPELAALAEGELIYPNVLAGLEKRYANERNLQICGLSLGAILALDYTIRHSDRVSSLVLIGAQYQVPTRLIDFQNLLFRCMPRKAFADMGIAKRDMIRLSHSMRSLDFTAGLKQVNCPAAIVCGEKDSANRKAARQLKERLPQAKLYIIPGAGHEVNQSAPEAIAEILKMLSAQERV